jgi:dihydrofolate reductase
LAENSKQQELERRADMRKLVVKEWMTLDGVFDAETMDQWWNPYESTERQAQIIERFQHSDTYLLGRASYELLFAGWSQLPDEAMGGVAGMMNHMRKYVVSSTLARTDWQNSSLIDGDVVKAITRLKQQPGKDFLIDGSATLVHSLMATDLIDEYRFLVQPIFMGRGKRFFTEETPTTKLRLVESRALSLGVLALTYQPDKHSQ